jgi:hypothetical protein
MWGALLATSIAGWLHPLIATSPTPYDQDTPGDPEGDQDTEDDAATYPSTPEPLAGLGVRDGKAMIATLRQRLLCLPGRLIHHAGQLILRLPPGHQLLPVVLARLRALPHPS